jgi:hypothetical protein
MEKRVSAPAPAGGALTRAPLLTSPLALRQEPLARSVAVHTLGWRPRPRARRQGKRLRGPDRDTGDGVVHYHDRQGTVQGVHVRYCRPLQRSDGYMYTKGEAARPPQA